MSRFKIVAIALICIAMLFTVSGCWKKTSEERPPVTDASAAEPFSQILDEEVRIVLPEVPVHGWDENQPDSVEIELDTMKPTAKTSDSNDSNDLPEVPAGVWDEDQPETAETRPTETRPGNTDPSKQPTDSNNNNSLPEISGDDWDKDEPAEETEPNETVPDKTEPIIQPTDDNLPDAPMDSIWD